MMRGHWDRSLQMSGPARDGLRRTYAGKELAKSCVGNGTSGLGLGFEVVQPLHEVKHPCRRPTAKTGLKSWPGLRVDGRAQLHADVRPLATAEAVGVEQALGFALQRPDEANRLRARLCQSIKFAQGGSVIAREDASHEVGQVLIHIGGRERADIGDIDRPPEALGEEHEFFGLIVGKASMAGKRRDEKIQGDRKSVV